jgi:hypothetical protein|nr:DUF1643 domain-containing protein [uncultured Porphyromonas sp.]
MYKMIGDDINHRYVLSSEGAKPLVVIGVNPSTANESKLDATMRRVRGFAEHNDYDGFVMINLYPQRATNFGAVPQQRNEELHQKNLEAIRAFFKESEELDILAAWGNHAGERTYLKDCFRDIVSVLQEGGRKVAWKQIGALTKKKHPRHPLYARQDSSLEVFDVARYLEKRK